VILVLTLLLATPATAECIALNAPRFRSCAAPFTSTKTGARQIINGCPLAGRVRALTQVLGIGQAASATSRRSDWPASVARCRPARVRSSGAAPILPARWSRLPDGLDWPCDAVPTACSRWSARRGGVRGLRPRPVRAGLAVCYYPGELELDREIVRRGYALAWYPRWGAVLGRAMATRRRRRARPGRGTFTEPWVWRRGDAAGRGGRPRPAG
jgi:hypothetical protein